MNGIQAYVHARLVVEQFLLSCPCFPFLSLSFPSSPFCSERGLSRGVPAVPTEGFGVFFLKGQPFCLCLISILIGKRGKGGAGELGCGVAWC